MKAPCAEGARGVHNRQARQHARSQGGPISSIEQITAATAASRKLIGQLLETQEELTRALARSPQDPHVRVLREKMDKLRIASEKQFLLAMDAIAHRR